MDANTFTCDVCNKVLAKSSKSKHLRSGEHLRNLGESSTIRQDGRPPADLTDWTCDLCGGLPMKLSSKSGHLKSKKHSTKVIPTKQPTVEIKPVKPVIVESNDNFHVVKDAFKGFCKTYMINIKPNIIDPFEYLENIKPHMAEIILQELREKTNIKVQGSMNVEFSKTTTDGDEVKEVTIQPWFNLRSQAILHESDISGTVNTIIQDLGEKKQTFEKEGSCWLFNEILSIYININKYNPLRASSYIDLPKKVKDTKAILNIQNDDNKCFMWSILASLHMS